MNTALRAAIREAYATVPADELVLETLELTHSTTGTVRLVRDRQDHTLTLETGVAVTFTGCAFRMALPAAGENGTQDLQLGFDNTNRAVSDFVLALAQSAEPARIIYRPYLASDTTRPQMDPPLELVLSDVVIGVVEVTGRASFADVLNKRFPLDYYTRARFPSLGD